jgi:hypothetical protein
MGKRNMRVGTHACKNRCWTDVCKDAYYHNISQMLPLARHLMYGTLAWKIVLGPNWVYIYQGILVPLFLLAGRVIIFWRIHYEKVRGTYMGESKLIH